MMLASQNGAILRVTMIRDTHFLRSILLGSALVTALASCGSPARKVFARFNYMLTETGGAGGNPRMIEGYDGDNGMRISCSVSETAQRRVLSFSLDVPASQTGLSIAGAEFIRGTGALPAQPTQGCSVTVREGNSYSGVCGGSEPTAQTACRINNVEFKIDPDNGSPVVVGRVFCSGLRGTTVLAKDLSSGTFADRTQGAAFTIYDCPGLAP